MGASLASPMIFKRSKTLKDVLDNSCIKGEDTPLENKSQDQHETGNSKMLQVYKNSSLKINSSSFFTVEKL